MTYMEGRDEHSHVVTRNTEVTLDGRQVKPEDLKKGYWVKVTTGPDKRQATKIEANAQRNN